MRATTIKALANMTIARGCTVGEAAAAIAALRRAILKLEPGSRGARFIWAKIAENQTALTLAIQSQKVEQHKAKRGWQFRKCGKRTCHCMTGGALHGPYRYGRRRTKRERRPGTYAFSSVYQGKG